MQINRNITLNKKLSIKNVANIYSCPNKANNFSIKVACKSFVLNLVESDFLNLPILTKSIPNCPGTKLAMLYASELTFISRKKLIFIL